MVPLDYCVLISKVASTSEYLTVLIKVNYRNAVQESEPTMMNTAS